MVKVLCYKSEGRCFCPSWCRWKFLLILYWRGGGGVGAYVGTGAYLPMMAVL